MYTSDFRILVGELDGGVYGGIEFGNSKDCIIVSSVSGLETPPIRNNNGDWSGKDGGYMSSQLYSGRVITVSGTYWDEYASCSTYINKKQDYSTREKLTNALVIRKLYPIFIKFMNGKVFFTEGYLTDFKMDYNNYKVGDYQITFYCPDYALAAAEIYGDKTSIYKFADLYKEMFGGHLVAEKMPVLFRDGRHTTQIKYSGLIPCYPTITLKGPSKNPTFINASTNSIFKVNIDLTEGQTMIIDMEERQVTIGGKSISMKIDENSQWWYLKPGINKVYYISSSEGDNVMASLRFRDLYQGV